MKRALAFGLLSWGLVGCVVSTFEGPGEPPRVALSPLASAQAKAAASAENAPDLGGPAEIAARHLLVAYQGAKRASPSVTRSKAEG